MRIVRPLALFCALLPGAALATTADDLCSPSDDPCVASAALAVDDGSVINVGERRLVVTGRLDVGPGEMRIIAASVVVDGELRATGNDSTPGGTIRVLAGSIEVGGTVDVTGSSGGTVAMASAGMLEVDGRIDADHRAGDESGGEISLDAATAVVRGDVSARGGADASGGDFSMSVTGALSFEGTADLSGGDGGDIELSAGGLTVADSATLRSDATLVGCDGGDITLTSAGGVAMDGKLISDGHVGNEEEGGGSAGTLTIEAAGRVATARTALIRATGARPDGFGGDVEVSAGGAAILGGPIDVHSGGNDGIGGSLLLDADGPVDLDGNIDASGDGGGDVDASSGDRLGVRAGITIDVAATGGGGGGEIRLDAEGTLAVEGSLRSDGSNSRPGSLIRLNACTIRIERDASLSSLKLMGRNVLIGREETVIAGRLRADPSTGANEVRFPDASRRPTVLSGASIDPAPMEIIDSLLAPCAPIATPTLLVTATPTHTPAPSATSTIGVSPTPTPTTAVTPTLPPPAPCVGDCDEDGAVAVDELILAADIALGRAALARCARLDRNGDQIVTVDEPLAAVTAALGGCLP